MMFVIIQRVSWVTVHQTSIPFMGWEYKLRNRLLDSAVEYYRDVRILDEIDNRWSHAAGRKHQLVACGSEKCNPEALYPRNPTHTLRNAHMSGIHLSSTVTIS